MPYTITLAIISILYALAGAKKYKKYLSEYNHDMMFNDFYNKKGLDFINKFESISLTLIVAMFVCFLIESQLIKNI